MNRSMIVKIWILLSVMASCSLHATETAVEGSEDALAGKVVFIHLTANFKENDGPVCVAFNAAWRALREGASVEIFFDQGAAYGLKQWEPGKTDLGLYPLPERIKDLLAESFEVERESLPHDYQEYLRMLHKLGAGVLVNGFWNALTEIEKTIKGQENILPFAEPLTLKEVLERRGHADIYWRF